MSFMKTLWRRIIIVVCMLNFYMKTFFAFAPRQQLREQIAQDRANFKAKNQVSKAHYFFKHSDSQILDTILSNSGRFNTSFHSSLIKY